MNWPLFISTFSLVFIAELPDKTALATVMLATRGRPGPIFSGVAVAFLIQCLVAVAFGRVIGLLPEQWVRIGAGLLFIAFAVHSWYFRNTTENIKSPPSGTSGIQPAFFKNAWAAFLIIFVAEWGDLTQLATASMAAHYPQSPGTVLLASICALWSVATLAILVGSRMKVFLADKWLRYLATATFASVGSYFLVLATWPELSGL